MSLTSLRLMREAEISEEAQLNQWLDRFKVSSLPPYNAMTLREAPTLDKGKLRIVGEWKKEWSNGGPYFSATAEIDPKTLRAKVDAYIGICGTGTSVVAELSRAQVKTFLRLAQRAIDAGTVPAARDLRATLARALVR